MSGCARPTASRGAVPWGFVRSIRSVAAAGDRRRWAATRSSEATVPALSVSRSVPCGAVAHRHGPGRPGRVGRPGRADRAAVGGAGLAEVARRQPGDGLVELDLQLKDARARRDAGRDDRCPRRRALRPPSTRVASRSRRAEACSIGPAGADDAEEPLAVGVLVGPAGCAGVPPDGRVRTPGGPRSASVCVRGSDGWPVERRRSRWTGVGRVRGDADALSVFEASTTPELAAW